MGNFGFSSRDASDAEDKCQDYQGTLAKLDNPLDYDRARQIFSKKILF